MEIIAAERGGRVGSQPSQKLVNYHRTKGREVHGWLGERISKGVRRFPATARHQFRSVKGSKYMVKNQLGKTCDRPGDIEHEPRTSRSNNAGAPDPPCTVLR